MEYKKTEEIWKDIPRYEGIYQASTFGRIRSIDRKITTNGNCKIVHQRSRTGRILVQREQNGGYYIVSISVNGKRKVCTVHRLVAKTFLDNTNNFRDVNHKDGNKKNNNIDNLEWISHSDNIKHSYHQLNQKRHFKSIKCIETGIIYSSCKEASEQTGINRGSINHAISGLYKRAGGFSWKRV